MIEALEAMGMVLENAEQYKTGAKKVIDGEDLVMYPKGLWETARNRITYANGVFNVPSTMLADRFSLEKLQNAYGMAAAKLTAKKNGWLFEQKSETEFEFVRK